MGEDNRVVNLAGLLGNCMAVDLVAAPLLIAEDNILLMGTFEGQAGSLPKPLSLRCAYLHSQLKLIPKEYQQEVLLLLPQYELL